MFYKLVHGTDKNNLFEELYYNRKSAYSSFKYMLRHYEWLIAKGDLKENYTCLLYTIKDPLHDKEEEKNNAQKHKKAKRRPL